MTPQAVIFDIGNVLFEWQPERHYDRRLGPDIRRRLFAEVDLHRMNELIDAGAPFRATIHDWADRHPQWADAIRMWHDEWDGMAAPVIERSVRLFRALRRRGVPVFALTNFGRDSFAHARTIYDFLSEFDRAYVSGEMG